MKGTRRVPRKLTFAASDKIKPKLRQHYVVGPCRNYQLRTGMPVGYDADRTAMNSLHLISGA
jgi:hypothetical protein